MLLMKHDRNKQFFHYAVSKTYIFMICCTPYSKLDGCWIKHDGTKNYLILLSAKVYICTAGAGPPPPSPPHGMFHPDHPARPPPLWCCGVVVVVEIIDFLMFSYVFDVFTGFSRPVTENPAPRRPDVQII